MKWALNINFIIYNIAANGRDIAYIKPWTRFDDSPAALNSKQAHKKIFPRQSSYTWFQKIVHEITLAFYTLSSK